MIGFKVLSEPWKVAQEVHVVIGVMQMLQQAWKNSQDKKKKQLGAAKRYVLPNAFKSQL